jgi:glycosyltransferase involved in cell wall biosynthesis
MIMHILYLHQYFVPPDGKGGTRSYEFALRMVRRGHRVTMITSSAGLPPSYRLDQGVNRISINGIDLRVLHVEYSNHFSYAQRIKAFFDFAARSIVQTLREGAVDVIYATSTPLTIALPAIVGKLRHSCPMVFEVRDLWPEIPIAVGALKNPLLIKAARLLEMTAYHHAVRVVALSPGMAAGIEATGYPADRITVIPNCCDTKLFRVSDSAGRKFLEQHPYLQGGPLIVYCGTLGIINGIDYLVRIAEQAMELSPSVRFLIAGDGIRREAIEAEAKERKVLGKNLWMIPFIPKKDLPALLSAATIATSFVIDLPALWNNSANKFFDAMAASRPIAINHAGWLADFIGEAEVGLVLPPSEPRLAAQLLVNAAVDEKFLERARKSATEAADTVFNRDVLASQVCDLLEQAVVNHPACSPASSTK